MRAHKLTDVKPKCGKYVRGRGLIPVHTHPRLGRTLVVRSALSNGRSCFIAFSLIVWFLYTPLRSNMPKEKKKKPFECPYCMLPCASTGGVTKHIKLRHHRPPVRTYSHNASRRRQYLAGSSRAADDTDWDDVEEQAREADLGEVS